MHIFTPGMKVSDNFNSVSPLNYSQCNMNQRKAKRKRVQNWWVLVENKICDGTQLLKIKRIQVLIMAQIQLSNPPRNHTGDCVVRQVVRHGTVQMDSIKKSFPSSHNFAIVAHNCLLTQALSLLATYSLHTAALSMYVMVGNKKKRRGNTQQALCIQRLWVNVNCWQ